MKLRRLKSAASTMTASVSALAHRIRAGQVSDSLFVLAGVVLALALRLGLLDFKSLDFYASLKPWYNTIKTEGFTAFAMGFSTYNPPYLYLLYLIARFIPDAPVTLAVKLPSLVADFICAFLVYLIVRKGSSRGKTMPVLAAMAVLFAPSVVLNSAFWGQADSLFTAGLLACVYCLMIRRPGSAMFSFGIALAFKLQAVFLAPLLFALVLKGQVRWRDLLLVPAVLLLAIIPAWAAGRPLDELLGVYAYQASQFEFITMNAPTIYAWLPGTKRVFNLMYAPGILTGIAAAFMCFIVLHKSRRTFEGRLLLEVALICLLVVPLFLPKMHERYFYPADILAIAVGFLYPGLFYVPLLIVGVSFLSYQPFLFERDYVPLPILAFVLIAVTSVLSYHAMRELHGGETPAPDQISDARHAASGDRGVEVDPS
jgi:Gpi18-like mannosyltransferase